MTNRNGLRGPTTVSPVAGSCTSPWFSACKCSDLAMIFPSKMYWAENCSNIQCLSKFGCKPSCTRLAMDASSYGVHLSWYLHHRLLSTSSCGSAPLSWRLVIRHSRQLRVGNNHYNHGWSFTVVVAIADDRLVNDRGSTIVSTNKVRRMVCNSVRLSQSNRHRIYISYK